MPPEERSVIGHWVHSFEEDHDDVSVYRPADFAFPPARGRRRLEVHADGTLVYGAIGRGDAPDRRDGTWTARGDGPIVGTTPGRTLRVTVAGPGRLEVVDEADR